MVETLNCTIISCHQTYVVSKLVTIREKILEKTVQFEYSYVYWERERESILWVYRQLLVIL